MALCTAIVGIPKDCGDNNLGAAKRALVGSYDDVTGVTLVASTDPNTVGTVDAITRATGTKFEDFPLLKDTSSFMQELVVDPVADTHSWKQQVDLGFRRIDLRKRNAITLLAAGRRDLIVVVQDNNDQWWMLGKDQGMRLSAASMTSNNTRAAGQQVPVTLVSENERHMWYKVDEADALALLVAAA